jgi:MFS superfamily sulfate permease-like transporter
MALLGLLRLGSNAVMTGFTTGIAVQIVAGVIDDATGHETDRHNTLAKLVDGVGRVGAWEPRVVRIAGATVAVWCACRLIAEHNSRIIFAGIGRSLVRGLERGGLASRLGLENIVPAAGLSQAHDGA